MNKHIKAGLKTLSAVIWGVCIATSGRITITATEPALEVVEQATAVEEQNNFKEVNYIPRLSRILLKEDMLTQTLEIKIEEQETEEIIIEEEETNNELSDEEWEALWRVVTAEAGYNCKQAQKNVVYVILNRINSERFEQDNIIDVIYAPGQFACIENGYFYEVYYTEEVGNAIIEALGDYVINESIQGAVFFTRGVFSNREFLFTDEVGHNFFK